MDLDSNAIITPHAPQWKMEAAVAARLRRFAKASPARVSSRLRPTTPPRRLCLILALPARRGVFRQTHYVLVSALTSRMARAPRNPWTISGAALNCVNAGAVRNLLRFIGRVGEAVAGGSSAASPFFAKQHYLLFHLVALLIGSSTLGEPINTE